MEVLYIILCKFVFLGQVIACLDVRSNDSGDLVVTKGDQYDVREQTTENEVVLVNSKHVKKAETDCHKIAARCWCEPERVLAGSQLG